MRELYSAELIGDLRSSNQAAWPTIQTWANRHIPSSLSEDAPTPKETRSVAAGDASVTAEESSDGQRSLVLVQHDEGDPSILWRSEIAVGPPESPLHATIRVRIGSVEGTALRPLDYEFGVPGIVRSLLRDFNVYDAGLRIEARYVEIGASDIPNLVSWLINIERRLPVVVVSRPTVSGTSTLDARSLANQLAGIAHVRLLSSGQAAWALSDTVGTDLGVWGGAVRVYFPGFSLEDDRYHHRLFLPDRANNSLITALRSWFGTLSAGSTPEHPIFSQLRIDRHQKLADALASGDPKAAQEYIELLEELESEQRLELGELKTQNSSLTGEVRRLTEENEAIKESFAQVARATTTRRGPVRSTAVAAPATGIPLTVSTAMDAAESLSLNPYYISRVSVSVRAIAKGREFSSYNNPDELLRAIQAVLEAGALYHDNKLGMPPMEFFNKRGFGYAAQPKAHLKVDEGTSPDQCLRIYWDDDAERRLWTITSIGEHE